MPAGSRKQERPFFHEDWFGAGSRRRLNEALRLAPPGPGQVIEVGSWEGRSTIEIANAIWPDVAHVIDHWKGDVGLGNLVEKLAQERDVFADFEANMAAATQGNYVVHRMDWRDYPWREPIRFLFIDAMHTYDEVADNIAAALPRLVPGAVIAGDDLHKEVADRYQVEEAVIAKLGTDVDHEAGEAVWWWVAPIYG